VKWQFSLHLHNHLLFEQPKLVVIHHSVHVVDKVFRNAHTRPTYELELPANPERVETYIFMGCTEKIASALWKRYLSSSGPLKAEFLESRLEHVAESPAADAISARDDWEVCLAALGINQTLREAILTEDLEDKTYDDH
jgi:hypothetical protein